MGFIHVIREPLLFITMQIKLLLTINCYALTQLYLGNITMKTELGLKLSIPNIIPNVSFSVLYNKRSLGAKSV